MGPFFDNRAGIIWEVPVRERLVNIGIRPSANSINMKRVVRLQTSVCFRITRLMNNQIKSQKKSYFPKRRESDDKNAVAIVKKCCVSQDSDALVSQGRKSRRSPMQKVLEPIQRVRFTKSTLGQASIREKKGPLLGKMNVEVPHQRSPFAMKFEYRSSIKIVKVSSDVPEARRGILPKTFTSSKKKTRLQPRAKVELGSGKLSEGPNLWYFLEDENNEGFL